MSQSHSHGSCSSEFVWTNKQLTVTHVKGESTVDHALSASVSNVVLRLIFTLLCLDVQQAREIVYECILMDSFINAIAIYYVIF